MCNRDFRVPRCLFCVLIVIALAEAQSARAVSPQSRPAQGQGLLRFVPESAESVFCIDTPFRIRHFVDLTEASVFESAICFSTMLVQREMRVGPWNEKICCAVSAIRSIRSPRRIPPKPFVDGPFQSQRCELYLLGEKLPRDWLNLVATELHAKPLEVAGHRALEVPLADENLLVAQISDNTLCVANHLGFLTEVLKLANAAGKQRPASVEAVPAFHNALLCVSPSAAFWGIRLFGHGDDASDPTSVRHTPSSVGLYDQKAVFVALELSTVESLDARFYYASCDSVAASGRFPAYLEQLVTVTRAREPLAVSPAEHDMKVVVSSTTAHLGKWKIAGMEEPGVQFLAFCGMFGQGLQL